MVSDIIATQEVNAIMNDVKQYNYELLQRAKLGGLSKLRIFLDMTHTDKLIGFRLIEYIPTDTHCKVMSGEINTYEMFLESRINEEVSDKYYAYLFQVIDNPNTEKTTYIIDSAYDQ